MTSLEAKVYLLRVLPELGEAERRVAVWVVERLAFGAQRYGALRDRLHTGVDWNEERRQEAVDLLVYEAIQAIEAEERG